MFVMREIKITYLQSCWSRQEEITFTFRQGTP